MYKLDGEELMKKVLVVFGTRPEAIKMCPLVLELNRHKNIKCVVCLTGQHKEMLNQVIDIFNIHVDYNMELMRINQSLEFITISVITNMKNILDEENPDLVLVHGDTTTSVAASMAAFYHHIPVGHVEAGLRTYNMNSPYPEEFNRQVVDLISDLYFAPTEEAKKNLLQEGKNADKIYVTGNTVIDALKTTVNDAFQHDILKWCGKNKLILLTTHRRENIGEAMENIFMAVNNITKKHQNVKVVYPVHKNPQIRELAQKMFCGNINVMLIEPLDVCTFHNIMNKSYLVLTDSGGIQEEAPSLGKPVLVMRDTTERPEGVAAGTLKLIGTNENDIVREVENLLVNKTEYEKMSKANNPYGDGHASEKIANVIENYFEEK